jgi:peptide/nickel transport system permease protein
MTVQEKLAAMPGDGDASATVRGHRRRIEVKAVVALTVLVAFTVMAIAARLTGLQSGDADVANIYGAPSAQHWLGLDDAGRDVLTQLLIGSWPTLLIGLSAACVAMMIGGAVGLMAGYSRGWLDLLLLRVTDYFIVVPALPFAMVITAVWGPGIFHMIVVIGVLLWATTARVVRAQVKSGRERVYVQRVRILGASHLHVIVRHVLPEVMPLIATTGALAVAHAILMQAALEFLGLGGAESLSWGTMIRFAFQRDALLNGAWWFVIWPGVAISLVIASCYWLSQSVEKAINPRLRSSDLRIRSFKLADDNGNRSLRS